MNQDVSKKTKWLKQLPKTEGYFWCCYLHETDNKLFITKIFFNGPELRIKFFGVRGDIPLSSLEADNKTHWWLPIALPDLPEVEDK